MGRSTVLAAIVDYLDGGTVPNDGLIPFLGAVYGYMPKFVGETVLFQGQEAGEPSGAFVWAWLGSRREKRISGQGLPAGGKMRFYQLKLQCVFVGMADQSEDAQADNDTFLDGLHDFVVASKVPAPGVIFQWAEGDTMFGYDYAEEVGDPEVDEDAGTTHIYTAIQITVCEPA